jgi:hypothetical protein
MDEPVTKGLPDGCLNDEMPSRTRSGLVRRRPTFKVQKFLNLPHPLFDFIAE